MADLAALQQLIQQQSLAEGEAQGLAQQRANAMALRDSPVQQAGRRSGYSSPLSHIANVLNSYSGSKMQAEVEPMIAANQQAIAEGQAAQKNYALQKAVEQQEYDRQQDSDKFGRETEQEAYERGLTQDALEVAAAKGKRVDRVNPETNQPESIFERPDGVMIRNGEVLDNPSEWKEYQRPLSRSGSGNNPMAWSGKRRERFEDDAIKANTVTNMISNYSPEFANPADIPLLGSASNFLASNVGGLSSEGMKDRQAWWADYKANYELVARHGLFGAALTKAESAEWKKSAIHPDMDSDQIATNLAKMQELINRKASKQAGNARMAGLGDEYIEHNLGPLTPEEYRAERVDEEIEETVEELPQYNAQGWELVSDPQGNRAYMGPNGEIEEVR